MSQDKSFVWKAPGNSLGDLKDGGGGASGNHQGVANSMSHVDGVSYMAPEGSEKKQWPLPALV